MLEEIAKDEADVEDDRDDDDDYLEDSDFSITQTMGVSG